MLAEGNIAGWNSPFRQTAVSVSTSKQERMMKKKIGFIDLFIDEWHANHYPDWFRKARRAEEFELGLAWERAPFENRRPLEAWCRDFGMTPARSIEEVVEKSDAVCVLAPANPEVHLELADHALRSGKPVYVDKPFADSLTAKLVLKVGDNITTDHIMPAGAKILPYRSNIPDLSKFCFEVCEPTFAERAKAAGDGIVVGGSNYGQGSSREHAALVPMYLGIRCVVAKSFARIHVANLINAGILPLTFENPADYDALHQGAHLRIDGIRAGMAAGSLTLTDTAAGKSYPVVCSLTERQQAILLAGGLLNYTKEHAL